MSYVPRPEDFGPGFAMQSSRAMPGRKDGQPNKPGQGRKPKDDAEKVHRRQLWVTDAHYVYVQDLVEKLTGKRPPDRIKKEDSPPSPPHNP